MNEMICFEQVMDAAVYIEKTEPIMKTTRVTATEVAFITPHPVDSQGWLTQLERIHKALKHYCDVQPSVILQHVPYPELRATIQ